jgi:hypothetical protein
VRVVEVPVFFVVLSSIYVALEVHRHSFKYVSYIIP